MPANEGLSASLSNPFGKQDADNLANISQNSAEFLQGITDTKSIAQEQLGYVSSIAIDVGEKGWFAEQLKKLVGSDEEQSQRDEESKSLSESIRDALEDMKVLDETTNKNNILSKKKKGKVTPTAKLDDLKDLPYEIATLGAVLASTINNSKKDDKKKGGISGFFSGLMEGVGGIASLGVALIAFAGATLIFNMVDWSSAVIGLLSFTLFTLGMVGLSKLLGKKEEKNLIEFAAASLLMSVALGTFAISMWLTSALYQGDGFSVGNITIESFNIISALEGLGIFIAFELALVGISKLVGNNTGDFIKFAAGSLIMCAAIVAFSFSLVIVSHIFSDGVDLGAFGAAMGWNAGQTKIDPLGALAGVGTFLAFEIGLAVVARIVGNSTADFIKFAIGSVAMCGALVAFAFSLVIVSNLFTKGIPALKLDKVDPVGAIAGVGTFIVFLAAMTGLAIASQSVLGPMAILAGVSVLMSAALAAFGLAMVVAGVACVGGTAEIFGAKLDVPKGNGLAAIAAIGEMALFMAAFAGLGALFLIPFAGAAMAAGIAIASGILISIAGATILMAKAMMLAGLAISGGDAEIAGESYHLSKYDDAATKKFFTTMTDFMKNFVDVAKSLDIGAALILPIITASLIPIINAMDKMVDVVIKAGKSKEEIDKIVSGDSNALDHLLDPVLFVIMGRNGFENGVVKEDKAGGLMGVAKSMSLGSAIVLKLVTESLIPIVDAMDKMIDVVIKAGQSKDDIMKIVSGDDNALDHLLDPVLWLLLGHNLDGEGGLMSVAQQMSKRQAKILKMVSESVSPLVESMDKMVDVVVKAATLGSDGQDVNTLVTTGTVNMYLITKTFLPVFVETANGLVGVNKKAINAIESMPSMIQSLSDIIDVIAKAGELDPNKIQAGVTGLTAVSGFLRIFIETINDIIPGGVGGFMSKLFGGDPIEKLDSAHEYLKEGGAFYNIFEDMTNIAKKFDGKGFENLGKVAVIGSFTTNMLKSSVNFKDIMGNVQQGLEKFKSPQMINSIADALNKVASVADYESKFDPLYKLAEQSAQIHTTAIDIEKIAQAYERIAAAEKMGNVGTTMGKARDKAAFGLNNDKGQNSNNKASSNSQLKTVTENQSIEFILNEWYLNGVKIKQDKSKVTGKSVVNLMCDID